MAVHHFSADAPCCFYESLALPKVSTSTRYETFPGSKHESLARAWCGPLKPRRLLQQCLVRGGPHAEPQRAPSPLHWHPAGLQERPLRSRIWPLLLQLPGAAGTAAERAAAADAAAVRYACLQERAQLLLAAAVEGSAPQLPGICCAEEQAMGARLAPLPFFCPASAASHGTREQFSRAIKSSLRRVSVRC